MASLTLLLLKVIPVLGIILIILKIWSWFKAKKELQRQFKDFPGPKPHWLWGNAKELSGDYEGMLKIADYAVQYHGAFPIWMGPFDAFLMTVHPSTVKTVLSGSDPKDEFSYALMRPWIGDGLLLSGGRKWDRNRRLMTPAFHVDILKNYKKWQKANGSTEIFHHISLLTLDSMMQCLFGYHSNCQDERVRHPYIQGVYDVSEYIIKRIMSPHLHSDMIYYWTENGKKFQQACDTIHEHSSKIIAERRKLLAKEKTASRTTDFLDILLTAKDSDGDGLSNKEVQDEVDTFMFEGHDSTASSLSWCLYNLAKCPEYQDRCREEIQQHWGDKENITWDDLQKLEYTFMCIKESMRMFPPVPNISRCTEKDITLPDGRVIPKAIFLMNCIGMQFALTQIKIVIPMIIRKFHLELDPEKPAQPESMLIMRAKNGLYLKINPL
ncbi:hypothetical protein KUTeg_013609 [Tegillarca granosa]|uniref:Uncharacterized protein n=1 Tax=Tegillarca granosa TaxID=220873 RepID=A0ABQ9EU85_TEGGR|nr:hypothetical protein KUTeg_013609 [Tegillarca granosa]